jgi:hypothetical protein
MPKQWHLLSSLSEDDPFMIETCTCRSWININYLNDVHIIAIILICNNWCAWYNNESI